MGGYPGAVEAWARRQCSRPLQIHFDSGSASPVFGTVVLEGMAAGHGADVIPDIGQIDPTCLFGAGSRGSSAVGLRGCGAGPRVLLRSCEFVGQLKGAGGDGVQGRGGGVLVAAAQGLRGSADGIVVGHAPR